MNDKQKAHIISIIDRASSKMHTKYKKGTQEHSGHLWEVDGIIDMIIEESIDSLVYAYTLKDQLEKLGVKTGKIVENE